MANDAKSKREALRDSGWMRSVSGWTHSDSLDHHVQEARAASAKKERETADQRELVLDAVMDLLGIRDEYPDERTEVTDMGFSGPYVHTVTTRYGRERFFEDVKALREAQKRDAALTRIRSAIRNGKAK